MRFTVSKNLKIASSITIPDEDVFEQLYKSEPNQPAREDYNKIIKTLLEHPKIVFKDAAITENEFIPSLPIHYGVAEQTIKELIDYIENYNDSHLITVVLAIRLGQTGRYHIAAVSTQPEPINQAIRMCLIDEALDM